MRYHYFPILSLALDFLARSRTSGLTGYYLGLTCGKHEVRVW